MKKSISGIRGIVGRDFSLKDVLRFCNNFSVLIKSKKCVIANDTRLSSAMISDVVNASLRKNGVEVFNLGISPTPVLFREARKYGAGVVITSSHNPLEWNGLKFVIEGRGINEKELETVIEDQDLPESKIASDYPISAEYIDEAFQLVGKLSTSPKVSVDIGGGAAVNVVSPFLKKIGCDVKIINENLSSSTRGPDPTADDLTDLKKDSEDHDIGFAFDLDGDRLVVCRKGKKLTPDVTLGLGVAKALDMGYRKFVLSLDSSVSVEKFIKQRGGLVQRSKVGEANVIDMMIETKSQAGGEGSSGGFILPEFNYCRDGILTSGLISSFLNDDVFLDTLSFMENYHQLREKIPIEASLHEKTLSELREKMQGEYSEIILLDGIKGIIDEDSWILVRKSNTEDIVRISAESNNFEKTKTIVNSTMGLVKNCYDQVR